MKTTTTHNNVSCASSYFSQLALGYLASSNNERYNYKFGTYDLEFISQITQHEVDEYASFMEEIYEEGILPPEFLESVNECYCTPFDIGVNMAREGFIVATSDEDVDDEEVAYYGQSFCLIY